MSRPAWIALGSGRVAAAHVGPKAALLDRARAFGLSVPDGVVVPEETLALLGSSGVLSDDGGTVRVIDERGSFERLRLPDLGPRVAVRSAFGEEDREHHSLAGVFESVLRVDAQDPIALARALETVWNSAARIAHGVRRRDVLVMRMVEARQAGVAFTEPEFEDDLVNATDGTAEHLVAGQVAGRRLELPKLRRFERSPPVSDELPAWALRLQDTLRDVRRCFGAARGWDVEWADDGERCHVVQVRAITRRTVRDELFTLANHREILPDLPSHFMSSLIASCAGDLFEYYRRFDRRLPATRPFIEVIAGRPVINLSLLLDMIRSWGLPTRLVTDSIGGEAGPRAPLRLGRVVRAWRPLLGLALSQVGSTRSARRLAARIRRRTSLRAASFGGAIEELRFIYTALVQEMFALTAAMSPPLAILRRLGVVEEHASRAGTITHALHDELGALRAHAAELSPSAREALSRGEVPDDDGFRRRWAAFIAAYGHRGVYESDIARPRHADDPSALLRSLARPAPPRRPLPKRTALGILTWPLWFAARRAMRAREALRHEAMAGFARMRGELLRLARAARAADQLPEVSALWLLDIDEARTLDAGWSIDESAIARRRRERERLARMHLPNVLRRGDEVLAKSVARPEADEIALRGLPLSSGRANGVAWVLSEPALAPPPGFSPERTILVASAIDAGWIATFAHVAAIVVEIGGDLSHGSIVVREAGIPAVTNVQGALGLIRTGDAIDVDARAGVVVVRPASAREAEAGSR